MTKGVRKQEGEEEEVFCGVEPAEGFQAVRFLGKARAGTGACETGGGYGRSEFDLRWLAWAAKTRASSS